MEGEEEMGRRGRVAVFQLRSCRGAHVPSPIRRPQQSSAEVRRGEADGTGWRRYVVGAALGLQQRNSGRLHVGRFAVTAQLSGGRARRSLTNNKSILPTRATTMLTLDE